PGSQTPVFQKTERLVEQAGRVSILPANLKDHGSPTFDGYQPRPHLATLIPELDACKLWSGIDGQERAECAGGRPRRQFAPRRTGPRNESSVAPRLRCAGAGRLAERRLDGHAIRR